MSEVGYKTLESQSDYIQGQKIYIQASCYLRLCEHPAQQANTFNNGANKTSV